MNGKNLDLSSEAGGSGQQAEPVQGGGEFLGLRFDCCGAYARVYRNRQGDAYEGRCPKCLRPVRFEIGPGGTSERFFNVS